VSELIDLAEERQWELPSPPSPSPWVYPRWAFRGQPADYGTLTPSFQRQFPRHSYGTAERIERRLIEAFRKHYKNLKDQSSEMPIPDRLGTGYDLRCLSVMQHYEIPTRLLDWTSHFWTAIYFACASEPGKNAELWYYDRSIFQNQRFDGDQSALFDRSENPRSEPTVLGIRDAIVLELDPAITPRMQQQAAHHTVSSDVFADHAPLLFARQLAVNPQNRVEADALQPPTPPGAPGPIIDVEPAAVISDGTPETERKRPVDALANPPLPPTNQGLFGRVIIEGSCKSKALQFLAEEMGITASTIFPDVVGLGRFLRWQFDSLRTMLM
jgi:hypothetical protein